MSADCHIRQIEPDDLAGMARLHKEVFDHEAWDQKAITEVLAMPGAGGFVALDSIDPNALPLGMALYLFVAQDAELLTIAVRRGARRRGVGSSLVQSFLARAHASGAVQALLEVAEDNIPAQRLYSQLGFRSEGVRQNYYRRPGNKQVAAHLLRRPIFQASTPYPFRGDT